MKRVLETVSAWLAWGFCVGGLLLLGIWMLRPLFAAAWGSELRYPVLVTLLIVGSQAVLAIFRVPGFRGG